MSFAHFFNITHNADNRHFLCRARTNAKVKKHKQLPDGSWLVTLSATSDAMKKDPTMERHISIRMIEYQVEGHSKTIRLFTSLLDSTQYPAKEVAYLYHKRWELEVGFDELKTEMLHRRECLRSQTPEGIEQEIWALLLTYNLVR